MSALRKDLDDQLTYRCDDQEASEIRSIWELADALRDGHEEVLFPDREGQMVVDALWHRCQQLFRETETAIATTVIVATFDILDAIGLPGQSVRGRSNLGLAARLDFIGERLAILAISRHYKAGVGVHNRGECQHIEVGRLGEFRPGDPPQDRRQEPEPETGTRGPQDPETKTPGV
jgi:hypothetical protein